MTADPKGCDGDEREPERTEKEALKAKRVEELALDSTARTSTHFHQRGQGPAARKTGQRHYSSQGDTITHALVERVHTDM